MNRNTSAEPAPPTPSSFPPVMKAFCLPFFVFMGFLALPDLISKEEGSFFYTHTKYWVYPLQTVACAALLGYYWRYYRWDWPKQIGTWLWTIGIAVLVLVLWISPQEWLGAEPRLEGFDPNVFTPGTAEYWGSLGMRFVRLVLIVPLLEEIFWRGFLLRYLMREDFDKIPFGSSTYFSFGFVALLFACAHAGPDFWPALVTGLLYNFLAVRTRSLGACVIAHAITNLLLGIYIMKTGQYGFW